MPKNILLAIYLLATLTLSACKGTLGQEGEGELQTYHAIDSTFSFNASRAYEKIVDEPLRILLQHENKDNPDYANMILIRKVIPDSSISYVDLVTKEVDERNAQGNHKLQFVEGDDSIRHYKYSKGSADTDDWYMMKHCKDYYYNIFYSGQNINKEEAVRLYNSIRENEYALPSFIETHEGLRVYKDIDLVIPAEFNMVVNKSVIAFENNWDYDIRRLTHAYSSKPTEVVSSFAFIFVYEINGKADEYLKLYLNKIEEGEVKINPIEYNGLSAYEFEYKVTEKPSENEQNEAINYVKMLNLMYKGRFYQIAVVSDKDRLDENYDYFVSSIRLNEE